MNQSKENIRPFAISLGSYFLFLILGVMKIGPFGSLLKLLAFVPIGIWIFEEQLQTSITVENACIFLFVLCVSFSCFWSIDFRQTLVRVVTQASFLMLSLAVAAYDYSKREITFLKRTLIWSSRITVLCTLVFASRYEGRIYLNGILQEDPNYLCGYFLCGMAGAVEMVLQEKQPWRVRLWAVAETGVYLLMTLTTGSRGGLIAVLSCCAVCCFASQSKQHRFGAILVLSAVAAVLAAVVWQLAQHRISPEIMRRFSIEELRNTTGTGRFVIWRDAIRAYLASNPFRQLFGYGSGTVRTVTQRFAFRYNNVIHNAFLENLLEIGLIGACSYAMYVFSAWNSARKSKSPFALAVTSGMVVMSLSLSIAAFKPYWNIILYVICLGMVSDRDLLQTKCRAGKTDN